MGDANTTRLREAATEFLDIFERGQAESKFAGLTQDVDASAGFFKPAAIGLPGEPTAFTGTATVHAINSSSKSYDSVIYEYTWGIDKNMLMRTDKLARGQVSAMLRNIVRKWVGHKDKTLTTLLATGESVGTHAASAIFSTTAATLNPSVTVNNKHGTAVSGSANEVLAALHAGAGLFEAMRNNGNDLVNGGNAPRVRLMYSGAGQTGERQYVYDALKPMLLNDKYLFEGNIVQPVNNPYLGANADMWMFDLDTPNKFFVVGVEQQADFVTNLGSQSDSDVILHRRNLGQTSYGYGVAFSGDPTGAVLLNDA